MKKMMSIALFAGLLPLVSNAAADASAPAAADVSDPATAPPTCKQPVVPSSVRAADDHTEFNDKFTAYQQCIKAYIETQNKLANAHISAANKAVADSNAFTNATNEKLHNSN